MELNNVRQIPNENYRRWFFDNDVDLIVWEVKPNTIVSFQFCYSKRRNEKALTWKKQFGFTHQSVDGGELGGFYYKQSPTLKENNRFDLKVITKIFQDKSLGIDKRVQKFVESVLLGI